MFDLTKPYSALVKRLADAEPNSGYGRPEQLMPLSVHDIITVLKHDPAGVRVNLDAERVASCLEQPLERSLVCLNVHTRACAETAVADYLLADVTNECDDRRVATQEEVPA